MRLLLEQDADRPRENLPTSDEVAAIIPDEYGDPSSHDIVLAGRSGPAGNQPRCHRINATHAAYMPLHYVLLFPHGDYGWHYQLQLRHGRRARQRDRMTLRHYFRFYLHVRNGHEMVPFVYCRLFQQYVVDAWTIRDQHQLDWLSTHQANLRVELYNGVVDALSRTDVDLASVGRRVILPSSYLGGARFVYRIIQHLTKSLLIQKGLVT
jgi:Helitron helicase-like domain at N-terminus